VFTFRRYITPPVSIFNSWVIVLFAIREYPGVLFSRYSAFSQQIQLITTPLVQPWRVTKKSHSGSLSIRAWQGLFWVCLIQLYFDSWRGTHHSSQRHREAWISSLGYRKNVSSFLCLVRSHIYPLHQRLKILHRLAMSLTATCTVLQLVLAIPKSAGIVLKLQRDRQRVISGLPAEVTKNHKNTEIV